jgi:hypothetical protein
MMVSIPVMVVVVAKGHGGEKGKEKLQKRWQRADFWPNLDSIFSSFRP